MTRNSLLSDRLHTDPSEMLAAATHEEPPAVPAKSPRIARLLAWRQSHQSLHHHLRVEGIRRSEKLRDLLRRNHQGVSKQRWLSSLQQNPKFQATTKHVAAKEWTLRAPSGDIHTFRNLRHFIRQHEGLFVPEEVIWKAQGQNSKITWCVAYQALARLRPGSARTLADWQGWTWARA